MNSRLVQRVVSVASKGEASGPVAYDAVPCGAQGSDAVAAAAVVNDVRESKRLIGLLEASKQRIVLHS